MIATWTENITIQSDDVDFNSVIRWSSLLGLMQRAADGHIEALGVSREQLVEHGMGWMLITLEVEMAFLPRYMDNIEISTWSRGSKGALWNRDYRLKNAAGEEIGTARSVWALVDIQKRKIMRPSAFPYEVPVHTESVGSPLDKAVIPEGTLMEDTYSHTVRYSGIDSNGHLNNARYADLCWDTLTVEELKKNVAGFKITYHQEARLNDEMTLRRSSGENNAIYVQGLSLEGANFFEAAIVLE
ncbi:Acyl-ACP thioesterase [Paenibacillus uliginis N3/975]|uniref:Acyl-ACP thioesterase n=1 Tax=Paenibacillus uliginis N3/975 TaxID=1313296 RepID=A0A1X7HPV3_9BACL|nr:acyl-ACP thioesterase domain-containing protein [Paenibacillus uliginis]SMF90600.1 Acyl-ACP thioesterase [Paenibacillus uliginis N3/975]